MHTLMSKTEEHQSGWKCFKCVFAAIGNVILTTGDNQGGMLLGISYRIKKITIKEEIAEIEIDDFEDKSSTWIIQLSKKTTRLNESRIRNSLIGENVRISLVTGDKHKNCSAVEDFVPNKCEMYLGDGYLTFY